MGKLVNGKIEVQLSQKAMLESLKEPKEFDMISKIKPKFGQKQYISKSNTKPQMQNSRKCNTLETTIHQGNAWYLEEHMGTVEEIITSEGSADAPTTLSKLYSQKRIPAREIQQTGMRTGKTLKMEMANRSSEYIS